jgi:hypothetical protein
MDPAVLPQRDQVVDVNIPAGGAVPLLVLAEDPAGIHEATSAGLRNNGHTWAGGDVIVIASPSGIIMRG